RVGKGREAAVPTRMCLFVQSRRVGTRALPTLRTLRLPPPQMFVEARHDLDEIARAVTVVELVFENAVPGVTAGAGRTGQAEDVGRADNTGGGARLHRRSADLLVTHHVKDGRESFHALLEQRLERLGRHVAASKAGAAGGDDHINGRIVDP